jgi:hypothetical protein
MTVGHHCCRSLAAAYFLKYARGTERRKRRDHGTVSLRYMDGKIATILPLAVVACRVRESGLSA